MMTLDELNALRLVFVEDDESGQLKATCDAGVQFWLDGRRMTIAHDGHSVNETMPDGYEPAIIYSRKRLKSNLLYALTQLSIDMEKAADMIEQYNCFNDNAKEMRGAADITKQWINEIILES